MIMELVKYKYHQGSLFWSHLNKLKHLNQTFFIENDIGELNMGKISEEFLNKFLTPDDIDEGTEIKISGEHEMVSGEFGENFIIPVTVGNKEYQMRLNKTNVRILVDKFKIDDTKKWIGKTFKVTILNQMVKNQMRKIFLVV